MTQIPPTLFPARESPELLQGAHRFGSLGNMDTFRMFFRPRKSIITRSSPIPPPPAQDEETHVQRVRAKLYALYSIKIQKPPYYVSIGVSIPRATKGITNEHLKRNGLSNLETPSRAHYACPPCGSAPCLKADKYDAIPSRGMPFALDLSISNGRS